KKVINGVFDRIQSLKDFEGKHKGRPDYMYQVPLEYLPGLGPKTFEKLLDQFETEMNVLHHSTKEALMEVLPKKLANAIIAMREGKSAVQAGGGGKYGRLIIQDEHK